MNMAAKQKTKVTAKPAVAKKPVATKPAKVEAVEQEAPVEDKEFITIESADGTTQLYANLNGVEYKGVSIQVPADPPELVGEIRRILTDGNFIIR